MSRSVRAFAVLVLTVLFLASPVAAAPLSHQSSLWDSVWKWLVELVLPEGPDDDPRSTDPVPNGDAGGGIDPDGKPGA